MQPSIFLEAIICATIHELPNIFWSRSFIAAFTKTLNLSLSWSRWIQFLPAQSIPPRTTSFLLPNLRFRLPSGPFHSVFSANNLRAFLFSLLVLHAMSIQITPSRYQIFWGAVSLERGPLSLVINWELLERKVAAPVQITEINDRKGSAALTTRHPSNHISWN
jgi:hypothetical protein